MLPGPPRELRPMFRDHALPLIEKRFGKRTDFACVTLKTTGIGESFLEERVAPSLSKFQGLELGYCARVGEVELRLLAQGAEARQVVERAEQISRELLGSFVYGKNDEQLDAKIVQTLSERGNTLALAESCTGGFIANRITNIPGASAIFLAGCVTYSNEAKVKFLGVKSETLAANGAVSEAVAAEMARGVLLNTGADYAISVTGIAGPGGGSAEKPV
jgi:nicotinamide-nucleotide amidase